MLVATRILLPWFYFADEKSDFHVGDGCCPKLTVFQPVLFAYSEAWSHSNPWAHWVPLGVGYLLTKNLGPQVLLGKTIP